MDAEKTPLIGDLKMFVIGLLMTVMLFIGAVYVDYNGIFQIKTLLIGFLFSLLLAFSMVLLLYSIFSESIKRLVGKIKFLESMEFKGISGGLCLFLLLFFLFFHFVHRDITAVKGEFFPKQEKWIALDKSTLAGIDLQIVPNGEAVAGKNLPDYSQRELIYRKADDDANRFVINSPLGDDIQGELFLGFIDVDLRECVTFWQIPDYFVFDHKAYTNICFEGGDYESPKNVPFRIKVISIDPKKTKTNDGELDFETSIVISEEDRDNIEITLDRKEPTFFRVSNDFYMIQVISVFAISTRVISPGNYQSFNHLTLPDEGDREDYLSHIAALGSRHEGEVAAESIDKTFRQFNGRNYCQLSIIQVTERETGKE